MDQTVTNEMVIAWIKKNQKKTKKLRFPSAIRI